MFHPPPPRAQEVAEEHARKLNRIRVPSEVYTTRRQILRYVEWFSEIRLEMQALRPAAQGIFDILSESEKWRIDATFSARCP